MILIWFWVPLQIGPVFDKLITSGWPILLADMAVSCGMCPGQHKLQFGGWGAQLETTNLGVTGIAKGEHVGESTMES